MSAVLDRASYEQKMAVAIASKNQAPAAIEKLKQELGAALISGNTAEADGIRKPVQQLERALNA
jgi:hypothetical protein